MSNLTFEQKIFRELVHGRCGCLWEGNRMNVCYYHAPPEVKKALEGKAKQELGIKYSIGKYGIKFGRPINPLGKKYGWKVIRFIPLWGWSFDPHEIIEAFANDPAFKISFKERKDGK